MSDTPRTDAVEDRKHLSPTQGYVSADFARQLERELNEVKDRLETRRQMHKQMDDYEIKLSKERDQWKQVAEELAGALRDLLSHGASFPNPMTGEQEQHQSNPGAAIEMLSHFNELEGKT